MNKRWALVAAPVLVSAAFGGFYAGRNPEVGQQVMYAVSIRHNQSPPPTIIPPTPRSHRAVHPRKITPVPTATHAPFKGVRLLSVSTEQTHAQSGDTLTLDYKIDNETGGPLDTVLGASLYLATTQESGLNDPKDDATLTINLGIGTYKRTFALPVDSAGTYDLLGTVNAPGFASIYDSMRTNGAVSVNGTVASTPSARTQDTPVASDSSPPPTNGDTLLDLQSSGTQQTQTFTTSGSEWQIHYAYDCGQFGSLGLFNVDIKTDTPDFFSPGITQTGASGHGTDYEHASGTFYLGIVSECAWHIVVTG